MFSEMIQSLLNSGGKTAAMQRYASLSTQVNNLKTKLEGPVQPQNLNPMDTIYPTDRQISNFENVLKSSTAANFGNLLLNSQSMNVNAKLFNAGNYSGIQNAIRNVAGNTAVTQASAITQGGGQQVLQEPSF